MDYRSLLVVPLAALALGASSAETYRLPQGWQGGASFTWPAGTTYLTGVAPESDAPGQRVLTVKSVGKRQGHELGAVWQSPMGYAGKRVRLTAQVRATGIDTWAGLVVRDGFLPLYLLQLDPEEPTTTELGAPGCADWCEVSVVADIPPDGVGAATVGLALLGNGQVWARGFKLEVVGPEVALSTHRFAAEVTAKVLAGIAQQRATEAATPTPPKNLGLH